VRWSSGHERGSSSSDSSRSSSAESTTSEFPAPAPPVGRYMVMDSDVKTSSELPPSPIMMPFGPTCPLPPCTFLINS